MEFAKLAVDFIGLLALPFAWLIFRELKEIWKQRDKDQKDLNKALNKLVSKEDCWRYRGREDKSIEKVITQLQTTNKLLSGHIGYHKGKEQKNETG